MDTELESGEEGVGNCGVEISVSVYVHFTVAAWGKGMRTLVSGENNMGILEELSANHVAKSVVLLIQGEDGGVRGPCIDQSGAFLRCDHVVGDVRVSAASVHFFSPSPRRKSSNLSPELASPRKGFSSVRLPFLQRAYSQR